LQRALRLGKRTFATKKAALAHFREILNRCELDAELEGHDFDDLIGLINFDPEAREDDASRVGTPEWQAPVSDDADEVCVRAVRVARGQYGSRCFEVVYDDGDSWVLSYILLVTQRSVGQLELVRRACRSAVADDLRAVKQAYFAARSSAGSAPCQESGVPGRWEDLVVDHRQPNTFSVIFDRWLEARALNVDEVETTTDSTLRVVFADAALAQDFRVYHQKLATLRVVRRDLNASRAAMGRVCRSSKDLIVEQIDGGNDPQLGLFGEFGGSRR
jgi:hypothetical protein